jgi:hypothetical protein
MMICLFVCSMFLVFSFWRVIVEITAKAVTRGTLDATWLVVIHAMIFALWLNILIKVIMA